VSLLSSLRDGGSQTIAFGDKLCIRGSPVNTVPQSLNIYTKLWDPYNGEIYGERRPTFADSGWHDVLPVHDATTRKTGPSVPGKTFQVPHRTEDVDPHILSTPFRAGLAVALFDGSVRTLSPNVSESVYWALVTQSAGDFAALD
jgi:hypothetical protein